MKINVILSDTGVQDGQGKLHLLGVGWSQIGIGPSGLTGDITVSVLAEVPWDMCNRELNLALDLETEDRQPVMIPMGDDRALQPIRIVHKLLVPTMPGAPNGSPGNANLLVKFQGGLLLSPGSWYCFRASVEGEQNDHWTARFFVRRQPTAPSFGGVPIEAPGT